MKHSRFKSITWKSCSLIIGIGLIMALMIHTIMPSFFFKLMNAHISNHITGMMYANTIGQSYIWHANSTVFHLSQDTYLQEMIFDYYTSDDEAFRASIKTQLLDNIKTQQVGIASHQIAGEGAISATSYYMIYTDGKEALYWKDAEEIASVILNSGWLSSITDDMDMVYSPVLGDESLSVICFVMPFSANGMPCLAIHMMDFSYILKLFRNLEEVGICDYCFIQNERILYENSDYQFDLDSYPEYMFSQLQYETQVWLQSHCMDFITLCSYEGENLKIAVHADRNTLLSPYKKVIQLMEFALTGSIFFLVAIIVLLLKNLLKRLTVLNQRINCVIDGNYTPLPEDLHHDEIGNMTQNFNLMLQTVRQDIDQKLQQEKRESQMQYSLLVSAIDPHFICNILNTVTFLAHMKKNDEIAAINFALIEILRDRLAIKNLRTCDTIETEMQIIDQYLLIQSYLCHNTICYHFEAPKEDLHLLMPKNILQILVENSIKHGLLHHKDTITHKPLDGEITINVQRDSTTLVITVKDNGVGISEESIQKYFETPLQSITDIAESEHIGIYNIRRRLNYLYGENYSFRAENNIDGGCTVTLMLPVNLDL